MYEDLNEIAKLKFAKEMNAIAAQSRQNVQEAANRFAATAGAGIRSGQHDASLGRLRIEGVERMARALFLIWVDLIKQRNGHIARPDIDFVVGKIEQFIRPQTQNLNRLFAQQGGAVVPTLVQEAAMRMRAVSGSARIDIEIMAREHEAFPKKVGESESMKQTSKKRFSVGRRVLVGVGMRPGTVQFVADTPSVMGEFVHEVLLDGQQETLPTVGCDIHPLPGLDEDLRGANQHTIHIQNSNIANLNLGSQIGTINAALQSISRGDEAQREFARALEEFTQAVVAQGTLPDADKQEVVQALSTLAEQAAKNPEERSKGTLRAVAAWIPTAISAVSNLATFWEKVGPTIKAFLGV